MHKTITDCSRGSYFNRNAMSFPLSLTLSLSIYIYDTWRYMIIIFHDQNVHRIRCSYRMIIYSLDLFGTMPFGTRPFGLDTRPVSFVSWKLLVLHKNTMFGKSAQKAHVWTSCYCARPIVSPVRSWQAVCTDQEALYQKVGPNEVQIWRPLHHHIWSSSIITIYVIW